MLDGPPPQGRYKFEYVDPADDECLEHILTLTRCLAWKRFRGQWDVQERVNDSVSVAWEFAQAGRGTPATVARFAIRRVACRGQFSRSTCSVDHNQPGRTARRRGDDDMTSSETDPADEAVVRADYEAWLAQLPPRLHRVAMLLGTGLNTVEVAKIIGCTRGNISGIRQQLNADYQLFHGLE